MPSFLSRETAWRAREDIAAKDIARVCGSARMRVTVARRRALPTGLELRSSPCLVLERQRTKHFHLSLNSKGNRIAETLQATKASSDTFLTPYARTPITPSLPISLAMAGGQTVCVWTDLQAMFAKRVWPSIHSKTSLVCHRTSTRLHARALQGQDKCREDKVNFEKKRSSLIVCLTLRDMSRCCCCRRLFLRGTRVILPVIS